LKVERQDAKSSIFYNFVFSLRNNQFQNQSILKLLAFINKSIDLLQKLNCTLFARHLEPLFRGFPPHAILSLVQRRSSQQPPRLLGNNNALVEDLVIAAALSRNKQTSAHTRLFYAAAHMARTQEEIRIWTKICSAAK
jgi:hypothetical protein